jgi:RHS repeat-associated protein
MTTTFGSVYYHHDGLGNTIAITNGNADVLERYSYDVFGRVTVVDASTGNTIPQTAHGVRHFYTGHDFQAELGLYLTHYRAYEPVLGRWLSADPIGEAGGINLYGYVFNNAVNYWDPLGLDWEYSQSRGTMTHIDSKGKRTEVAKGYSGAKGEHQNNPASQHLKDKGPIPRGQYEIGNPRKSRNTGNHVMDLKPHPDNEMHGRKEFQIHGDNPNGDKSASKGCIILPLEARKKISSSGDKKLIVVK